MKQIYLLKTLLLCIGITLFVPKSSIAQCVSGSSTFTLTAAMLGGNPRNPANFPLTVTNVNGILGFDVTITKAGNFDGTGTQGAAASPKLEGAIFYNALDPQTVTGAANNFNRYIIKFPGTVKPTNIFVDGGNANFFSTVGGSAEINEQMRITAARVNSTGPITLDVNQTLIYPTDGEPCDMLTVTSSRSGKYPYVNLVQPLAADPKDIVRDPRYPFRSSNGYTASFTDARKFDSISIEYNYEHFKSVSTSKSNINAFSIRVTVACPVMTPTPANALILKASPLNSGVVKLDWSSLSEQNTDYYVVERSNDGSSFTRIGSEIKAAGNSTTTSTYSSVDNDASFNNIRYYRVVLKDIDGSVSYSNIVSVKPGQGENSSIEINPNLVVNSFNLKLTEPGEFQILLIDMKGTTIYKTVRNNSSANQSVTIDRQGWQSGMYLLKVINTKTNKVKTGRVVLQ